MKAYVTESYFFMVFIVIGAMALASIPFFINAFDDASDSFVVENMKKAQSEIYVYDMENINFKNACIRGGFILLHNTILLESGNAVSCVLNKNYKKLSLYTRLESGKTFCVDSGGYQGYVSGTIPRGRCSK